MDADQVTRLTVRWLRDLPDDGGTVLSGFGVWPLLAILADLADEPARSELLAVTGSGYANDLDLFSGTPDLQVALALWTRPEVPLAPDLDAVLPPELREVLTDRVALDRWVKARTDRLLDRMPVELRPDTLLVLASALAVRLSWRLPFDEHSRRAEGFGTDRWVRWLSRQDPDLGSLRRHETPTGPLTIVTVAGTGDVDVLLAAGERDRSRVEVLAAALECLGKDAVGGRQLLEAALSPGTAPASAGMHSQLAPAVTVIDSTEATPRVLLSVPHFEVAAEHDLLDTASALGLSTASDVTRGHFPRLSATPLAVQQAKQAVLARFSATGFEAAAVTAMAIAAGGAPQLVGKALLVDLDRPFGFLAVHRTTGIPVVLGWITEDQLVPYPAEVLAPG